MASEKNLDVVLRAAQVLFAALERHGFRVGYGDPRLLLRRADVNVAEHPGNRHHALQTPWKPERPTLVYLLGTSIGITLFEMVEEVEAVYLDGRHVALTELTNQQRRRVQNLGRSTSTMRHPSKRVCLQAYCPSDLLEWSKRWQEVEEDSFDQMVPDIIDELKRVAPEVAAQLNTATRKAEEERRRWEEQWEKGMQKAAQEKLGKAAAGARADLLSAIEMWHQSTRAQAFFEAVEARLVGANEDEKSEIRKRIQIASDLLASDPLAALRQWKRPEDRL